jgi:hypothetical protein
MDTIQLVVEAFAYPYVLLNYDQFIAPPAYPPS